MAGRQVQAACREWMEMATCIESDREPEPSGWEGLEDVRIIQASARFGRAVALDPIQRPARPTLGQEIRIPPHGPAPPEKTARPIAALLPGCWGAARLGPGPVAKARPGYL